MRIDINELEILPADALAGSAAEPDTAAGTPATPRRPAADLGEQLRHWHREATVREHRLLAD
jgi:hypothetical protein